MPRDDCRDCDRPVADPPPESDGRCAACAQAFAERQAAAAAAALEPWERPKEE